MNSFEELQQVTQAMALLFIALGLLLVALPVAECDECAHCKRERLAAAQRRKDGQYCFEHRKARGECKDQHE